MRIDCVAVGELDDAAVGDVVGWWGIRQQNNVPETRGRDMIMASKCVVVLI